MDIPSKGQFNKGVREFQKNEKREAMYNVANFLVNNFWGKPGKMADGLGVLLLTWNQAFYRYGRFNFAKLERFIRTNLKTLSGLRKRTIFDMSKGDEKVIKILFNKLLESLKIDEGKLKGRKSPVSVAKTLHLLAPSYFPLWDDKIARAYKCSYYKKPVEKYISFCLQSKYLAQELKNRNAFKDKNTLKLIDEYNYAKFTKKWI